MQYLKDIQSFSCFPESLKSVTYRARLLESTSETHSDSLISLIEEWVSGGASVIVTGVQITVDSECSVVISSLNEGECSPTQPPTTDNTTDTELPTTNTTAGATNSPSTNGTTGMQPLPDDTDIGTSTDQTSSINTVAAIGGLVVIITVLIVVVAITVIVIVALVFKHHHGDLSIKNTEK